MTDTAPALGLLGPVLTRAEFDRQYQQAHPKPAQGVLTDAELLLLWAELMPNIDNFARAIESEVRRREQERARGLVEFAQSLFDDYNSDDGMAEAKHIVRDACSALAAYKDQT